VRGIAAAEKPAASENMALLMLAEWAAAGPRFNGL
jgi:hypothetical protein